MARVLRPSRASGFKANGSNHLSGEQDALKDCPIRGTLVKQIEKSFRIFYRIRAPRVTTKKQLDAAVGALTNYQSGGILIDKG